MPVNRFILAVAALVLCGMTLGGCKDDWGDRASAFVDDDLPHLSRDLAKAELANRWERSMRLFNQALTVEATAFTLALAKLDRPAAPAANADLRTLWAYALAIQRQLNDLTSLELETSEATRLLKSQEALCNSDAMVYALNLDVLLREGILNINLPEPKFLYEFNTDAYGAITRMLSTNLFGFGAQSQNDKFDDAARRAPSKLILSEEIRAASRTACAERITAYAETRADLTTVFGNLAAYIAKLRAALNAERAEPEQRLVKLMAQRVADTGSLDGVFDELGLELQTTRLTAELFLLRANIASRQEAILSAESCIRARARLEDFRDYMTEVGVQIDAIGTSMPTAAIKPTLDPILALLVKQPDTLAGLAKAVDSGKCQVN